MGVALVGTVIRPARVDEIEECGRLWRDALNDYLRPLNQAEVPNELGPIGRLHAHTQATDPEQFIVALRAVNGADQIVAFGSAVVRGAAADGRAGRLWFLSMLFVRPEAQAEGLGRALLERLMPGPGFDGARATVVDSLQPISTGLYSRYGMVPRMPLLNLAGELRPTALPELPKNVRPVAFGSVSSGKAPGDLRVTLDKLDAELLGVSHPEDHAYLAKDGGRGFLYLGREGVLGYGYATERGRLGPIAVRDPSLLGPIIGHLVAAVPPRGASALWVPGDAGRLITNLLEAGLRLDEFPLLMSWDQPFADFSRYVPISPALL